MQVSFLENVLSNITICYFSYSLTNSKLEEINASVQENSYMAILQCVQDIYNGGVLKVPGDSKLQ